MELETRAPRRELMFRSRPVVSDTFSHEPVFKVSVATILGLAFESGHSPSVSLIVILGLHFSYKYRLGPKPDFLNVDNIATVNGRKKGVL